MGGRAQPDPLRRGVSFDPRISLAKHDRRDEQDLVGAKTRDAIRKLGIEGEGVVHEGRSHACFIVGLQPDRQVSWSRLFGQVGSEVKVYSGC